MSCGTCGVGTNERAAQAANAPVSVGATTTAGRAGSPLPNIRAGQPWLDLIRNTDYEVKSARLTKRRGPRGSGRDYDEYKVTFSDGFHTTGLGETEAEAIEHAIRRRASARQREFPGLYTFAQWKPADDELDDLAASGFSRPDESTLRARHRELVERAMRDGKPVAEEVLAEYPDLAQRRCPQCGQYKDDGHDCPQSCPQPKDDKAKPVVVSRSLRGPLGPVVEFGILADGKVYIPQPVSAGSDVSDMAHGWAIVGEQEQSNYMSWLGRKGKWAERARRLASLTKNLHEALGEVKVRVANRERADAEHEAFQERLRTAGERGYGVDPAQAQVGSELLWAGDEKPYVVTEIVDGGIFARPKDRPNEAGGFIGPVAGGQWATEYKLRCGQCGNFIDKAGQGHKSACSVALSSDTPLRRALDTARRNLDQDPNLAVFVVRDLPETKAAGLDDLVWAMFKHGTSRREVEQLLDDLDRYVARTPASGEQAQADTGASVPTPGATLTGASMGFTTVGQVILGSASIKTEAITTDYWQASDGAIEAMLKAQQAIEVAVPDMFTQMPDGELYRAKLDAARRRCQAVLPAIRREIQYPTGMVDEQLAHETVEAIGEWLDISAEISRANPNMLAGQRDARALHMAETEARRLGTAQIVGAVGSPAARAALEVGMLYSQSYSLRTDAARLTEQGQASQADSLVERASTLDEQAAALLSDAGQNQPPAQLPTLAESGIKVLKSKYYPVDIHRGLVYNTPQKRDGDCSLGGKTYDGAGTTGVKGDRLLEHLAQGKRYSQFRVMPPKEGQSITDKRNWMRSRGEMPDEIYALPLALYEVPAPGVASVELRTKMVLDGRQSNGYSVTFDDGHRTGTLIAATWQEAVQKGIEEHERHLAWQAQQTAA